MGLTMCMMLFCMRLLSENGIMQSRPRTVAARKRIAARKAARRAGNKPQLGIPPKSKYFVGKRPKKQAS
jgi:hypothetical protein